MYLGSSGTNAEPERLIRTPEDVRRHFFACDAFEPVSGVTFHDKGKRYLAMPHDTAERYTFGAVFLRRAG